MKAAATVAEKTAMLSFFAEALDLKWVD